ncbi:hypothetical protein [Pseudomonas sp. Marseille-QA0332]
MLLWVLEESAAATVLVIAAALSCYFWEKVYHAEMFLAIWKIELLGSAVVRLFRVSPDTIFSGEARMDSFRSSLFRQLKNDPTDPSFRSFQAGNAENPGQGCKCNKRAQTHRHPMNFSHFFHGRALGAMKPALVSVCWDTGHMTQGGEARQHCALRVVVKVGRRHHGVCIPGAKSSAVLPDTNEDAPEKGIRVQVRPKHGILACVACR